MKPIADSEELGKAIKQARKKLKLTQSDLALACGVGRRFIIDLEDGKETCQLGLTLKVLRMLGVDILLQSETFREIKFAG